MLISMPDVFDARRFFEKRKTLVPFSRAVSGVVGVLSVRFDARWRRIGRCLRFMRAKGAMCSPRRRNGRGDRSSTHRRLSSAPSTIQSVGFSLPLAHSPPAPLFRARHLSRDRREVHQLGRGLRVRQDDRQGCVFLLVSVDGGERGRRARQTPAESKEQSQISRGGACELSFVRPRSFRALSFSLASAERGAKSSRSPLVSFRRRRGERWGEGASRRRPVRKVDALSIALSRRR